MILENFKYVYDNDIEDAINVSSCYIVFHNISLTFHVPPCNCWGIWNTMIGITLAGASVPVHYNYTAPSEAINQISDICKKNMLKKNLDHILNTNGNI